MTRTSEHFIDFCLDGMLLIFQSIDLGLIGGDRIELIRHHTEGKQSKENRLNQEHENKQSI